MQITIRTATARTMPKNVQQRLLVALWWAAAFYSMSENKGGHTLRWMTPCFVFSAALVVFLSITSTRSTTSYTSIPTYSPCSETIWLRSLIMEFSCWEATAILATSWWVSLIMISFRRTSLSPWELELHGQPLMDHNILVEHFRNGVRIHVNSTIQSLVLLVTYGLDRGFSFM